MRDNLSIIITVILLVLLMVIFPLYNFFERQDDMSYNLVLKATSNFADEVMNNGYIDQRVYDNFVNELGNTGNIYDIEVEAHRKVLTAAGNDSYEEQSFIDYNDDIFKVIEDSTSSNLMQKSIKNNIYYFNPKDEIYVKVKNSNMTMAGALFNAIIPTSDKTRIEINYGGIIKNNAWKQIDATYTGHNIAPGAPSIRIGSGENAKTIDDFSLDESGYYNINQSTLVNNGIFSTSTFFEGNTIEKMIWKVTKIDGGSSQDLNAKQVSFGISNSEATSKLGDVTFDDDSKYEIDVYAVDVKGYGSEHTKIKIHVNKNEIEEEKQDEKIYGDINGDKQINEQDANLLREYITGARTLTDDELRNADYNNDGKFDINDFYDIQNKVFGFIYGDVTGDGGITKLDSNTVEDFIDKIVNLTDEQRNRADINKDGNIDKKDVDLIKYIWRNYKK